MDWSGIRDGIFGTAKALGVDPLDLATTISYETAGTFDPTKRGPTTQWGQHRGLIQFGEPQARQYGVNWDDPVGSQLGPDGAVAKYLRDTGVKPGMGMMDIYSAVNAGGVGRYDRTDANNGGAPGTVADKVNNQMAGHRQKAARLLGMDAGGTPNNPTISTRGGGGNGSLFGGILDDEGMQPMAEEKAGGILGALFPEMTANRQDRVALALGGMSPYTNPQLMNGLRDRMSAREQRGAERNAQMEQQRKANRTIEWLGQQPGGGPFAEALAAGVPMSQVWDAYTRSAQGGGDPSVQSSGLLPDSSGSVITMKDGSLRVVTAGGETLSGQAAQDFVNAAHDRAAGIQKDIYGARREGTLGANIGLGGEAERVRTEGGMAPKTAKEFGDSASLVRSNITNIDSALQAIDEGANSGIVYKMLPAFDGATASLRNSMNQMGLDVIGSVTFGALSAAEMNLAMETAVPQNLEPQELRKWLAAKREAQAKVYVSMVEAAQHFASGGTQEDYYKMIGANMENVTTPPSPQPASPGNSSGGSNNADLLKKYGGN